MAGPWAEGRHRGLWLLSLEPPSLAAQCGDGSDLHFEKAEQGRTWGDQGGPCPDTGPWERVVRAGQLREAPRATLCPGQSPESACVQGKPHLLALALHVPRGGPSTGSEAPSAPQSVCLGTRGPGSFFPKGGPSQPLLLPSLPCEDGGEGPVPGGGVSGQKRSATLQGS